MVTVYREVEVDVDASDFRTEELIEALERLDYTVIHKDDSDNPEAITDEIHTLYKDWISLDGKQFETKLKAFFSMMLNKNVL